MDELRKNHILQISTKNNETINGSVVDYQKDRIMVEIFDDSIQLAKKIKELDDLLVHAHTHCGIKKMYSSVISSINYNNCMVIENNASIPVVQKRKFVRVKSDMKFNIEKSGQMYNCLCLNISAGGIAFIPNEATFQIDDDVIIYLPYQYFEKNIKISAKIIKSYNNEYVAKYFDIDKYDEDKIMKYVFNLIAKK